MLLHLVHQPHNTFLHLRLQVPLFGAPGCSDGLGPAAHPWRCRVSFSHRQAPQPRESPNASFPRMQPGDCSSNNLEHVPMRTTSSRGVSGTSARPRGSVDTIRLRFGLAVRNEGSSGNALLVDGKCDERHRCILQFFLVSST